MRHPRPEPPLPGVATMAGNYTRALAAESAAIIRGVPPVETEEQTQRKAICGACPELRRSDDRCSLCGCHRNKKTAWRSQKCPIGKW